VNVQLIQSGPLNSLRISDMKVGKISLHDVSKVVVYNQQEMTISYSK